MINSSGINAAAVNASAATGNIEDVRDSAVALGEYFLGDRVDILDNVEGRGSAWAYPYYADVSETAVITGEVTLPLIRASYLLDTAVVTSSFDIVRTGRTDIRDPSVIVDTVAYRVVVHQDVFDTAVIAGDAQGFTPALDIVDSAVITSSASYSITARYTVRDSARITSQPYLGGSLEVRDSFVGTATPYETRTARYVVRDVAIITGADANDLSQGLLVDVTETAVALGYASTRLTARLGIRDAAYISDSMVSRDGLESADGLPADAVWTTNISSWGMSRHSGTGITQRGTRFAVSPAGLYELGQGYASAQVDTGFLSLGSKALKHVSTVYIEGERDGELTLTVTADRKGARAINSYEPIARDQSDSRSVRVDIGRGYRSTYYKLHIQTAGRAELFGGRILVANTQRRI